MKLPVILSIRGRQTYMDQEPESIELVTEGTLTQVDGTWEISYEETDLTGMEGVTTTFRVEPKRILLNRSGKLRSQMQFQEGLSHESLYQMELGTMMISVCASHVDWTLSNEGGVIDLIYRIEIEQSVVGVIDYHLEITTKDKA